MRPAIRLASSLVVVLGCMLPLWSAEKADDPRVAEQEEADREEELLREQGKIPDQGPETVLQGKYVITSSQEGGRTDIPGVFVVNGRAYQVKLGAEALRDQLAKFNGRMVTLSGKIRNQSKYFIVEEVLTQPEGSFVPAQAHTAPGRL